MHVSAGAASLTRDDDEYPVPFPRNVHRPRPAGVGQELVVVDEVRLLGTLRSGPLVVAHIGTMHRAFENAPTQNPVGSFSIRALMIGAPVGRLGGFGQSQRARVTSRFTVPSSLAHSRTIGASEVGATEYDGHQSCAQPP